ncbi:MAG: ferritin-like domain-containing protein [Gemmatimonadaceae bacterium]
MCPDRRAFMRLATTGAAALAGATALEGCRVFPFGTGHTLNFNTDFGVLNYAYALETLEADFYDQIVKTPPPGLRAGELDVLRDIRDHEVLHRRFFFRALGPFRIEIPDRDLSSINFGNRDAVLQQAKTFEDLGVAAYNGAGERLKLAEFLTIAGKIVSVEARHAAVIRNLINPMSRDFAGDDVIDAQGRDRAMAPGDVLEIAQPFFRQRFRPIGL